MAAMMATAQNIERVPYRKVYALNVSDYATGLTTDDSRGEERPRPFRLHNSNFIQQLLCVLFGGRYPSLVTHQMRLAFPLSALEGR